MFRKENLLWDLFISAEVPFKLITFKFYNLKLIKHLYNQNFPNKTCNLKCFHFSTGEPKVLTIFIHKYPYIFLCVEIIDTQH